MFDATFNEVQLKITWLGNFSLKQLMSKVEIKWDMEEEREDTRDE